MTVTSHLMPVPAIITGPLVNPAASASASSSSSSALVIPQSAPAGSVVITQPPQTATSYFKLAPSQTITFGWNFTDVLASPTSLTVSAACDNGNTYAVGPTNGIIPGSATTVLWDLYSYQQANPATPLVQGTYTLMMWDDRGPNVPREPGYMVPNNALRFAIYTPQSYTGLGDGESFPPGSRARLLTLPFRLAVYYLQRISLCLHFTSRLRRYPYRVPHHDTFRIQSLSVRLCKAPLIIEYDIPYHPKKLVLDSRHLHYIYTLARTR